MEPHPELRNPAGDAGGVSQFPIPSSGREDPEFRNLRLKQPQDDRPEGIRIELRKSHWERRAPARPRDDFRHEINVSLSCRHNRCRAGAPSASTVVREVFGQGVLQKNSQFSTLTGSPLSAEASGIPNPGSASDAGFRKPWPAPGGPPPSACMRHSAPLRASGESPAGAGRPGCALPRPGAGRSVRCGAPP